MNVYQKLALARKKLKESGLKQSGKNKGVGFSYFDLSDILPQTTAIEAELGLLSVVTFTETEGTLTVYNSDVAGESIVFKSPLKPAELRGCHPVQNLGAMETYVRRYLYLLAYEIVETDAVDSNTDKPGNADKPAKDASKPEKQQPAQAAKVKTKYGVIADIIKDTGYTIEDVNEYIINAFGQEIRINDLSDEQFENVVVTLRKNINKSA